MRHPAISPDKVTTELSSTKCEQTESSAKRRLCLLVIVMQPDKIVEQGLDEQALTKPLTDYVKRHVCAAFDIAA